MRRVLSLEFARTSEAAADMVGLHRRKPDIIREFADRRRGQLESDRFTLLRNRAKSVDPRAVCVLRVEWLRP